MRVIEGRSIRLRPLAEADLPTTRAWRNRDEIRRWFRTSEPVTAEGHQRWWRGYRERADDLVWIIEETPVGGAARPVGMVSLYDVDPVARRAEFGRLLVGEADAAGRGFAAEATRLVVGFALRDLALVRVDLEVRADNARAIALYERVGFRVERSGDGWVVMATGPAAD